MIYKKAESQTDYNAVRELFSEYFTKYNSYLGSQNFEKELSNIPEKYAKPEGCLIVAYYDETATGCVGIKKFDDKSCEMGRLYVKPEFRSCNVGYKLVEIFINEARKIGYKRILLDTVPEFKKAISLYKSFGFIEISPYYKSPILNPIYMQLEICNQN